jgi:hypothetical protein
VGGQPVADHQVKVQHQQQPQQRGENEHMHAVQPGDGVVPVAAAALDHPFQQRPDQGHGPGDAGLDQPGPVTLLIPGQAEAGDGKAHHQQQHHQPDDPVQLPRRPVGAPHQHLHQVQHRHHDQRRGPEAVHAAHEPACRQLVLDEGHRRPGGLHRRGVIERQEHAGDHLQQHQERGHGSEGVEPGGAAGDRLAGQRVPGAHQAGALVEPVAQTLQPRPRPGRRPSRAHTSSLYGVPTRKRR